MDILAIILTVLGLSLFETICSIDNAIINAQVLNTMKPWARRWFLLWGLLIAVFLVRGLLPWVIVWASTPGLGFIGSLTATFSNDAHIAEILESSAPILMMGGGVFLLFLFLHWIFMEKKNYGLIGEKFFISKGMWFFAIASIALMSLVWFGMKINPMIGFSAVVGSTVFFITHGFKESAEQQERNLLKKHVSDISKILYLEVIDATFSIDGVLGSLAFTLSIPLILVGNGIGAFVVRQMTVSNLKKIQEYAYLKNGAMYSIFVLGLVMIAEGFKVNIPAFVAPISTFVIVGYFFYKSHRRNQLKHFVEIIEGK